MARLWNPHPLSVTLQDGRPKRVRTDTGVTRMVTHVAATWVTGPDWWSGDSGAAPQPERTWYRLVLDGRQVWEIYRDAGGWWLARMRD